MESVATLQTEYLMLEAEMKAVRAREIMVNDQLNAIRQDIRAREIAMSRVLMSLESSRYQQRNLASQREIKV